MGKYLNTTQKFHRNQILVDHHHYEVFTDSQLSETQWQRVRNIQNFAQSIGDELSHHPAVVGEWSNSYFEDIRLRSHAHKALTSDLFRAPEFSRIC
ncbi:hypothetical protein ZYGR_0BA00230 [Zygosaccharomyces rouxii]|uniref:Uncharacterized protein n=1 Tax=Zygosaccharomyces rouxii TaxID=4956 RepID=A0A1Q3AK42_ZYGRO|nr:hypothetical protein ZYGR_0BA00230 [Zygosaccharomyces rouxii]